VTAPETVQAGAREVMAGAPVDEVLRRLGSTPYGLTTVEAQRRLLTYGPNSLRTHGVSAWAVLRRQLNNAVLALLAGTAILSYFLGDSTQAVIIGVILLISVGLGFINEYRAEKASAAMHSRMRHYTVVRRDGQAVKIDVTALVPGDIVELELGQVVPADIRLIRCNGLECNESILTGESEPVVKSDSTSTGGASESAPDTAYMGTVVSSGEASGIVYATGTDAQFGRIAAGLAQREPETDFQIGLRRFSYLLLRVALVLTAVIVVTNILLHRPLIDSALFALAIAVGITPQLLPAVVTTSLASGSRRLAAARVLVKRLVCIEDLGDIDILVTDKTGTLTEGRIDLLGALDTGGASAQAVLRLGLLATDVDPGTGGTSANELDAALWRDQPALSGVTTLAMLPFDHVRRATSVLVDDLERGRIIVVKGAPEQLMSRCVDIPATAERTLAALLGQARRVVAVAYRPAPANTELSADDERDLILAGFLVFADSPKEAARESLAQLAHMSIEVKVATGDHPLVAEKVCAQLDLKSSGTITGVQLSNLDDDAFAAAARNNTIFARVSPEQKARLISVLRRTGRSVGFLGDGVNDALALHSADVGISVDTATDIAKDAADVVLLEKDLGVLATGIAEGRRIFANTIKYVLMGTSSNFGNMFSAAAASAVLPFLPMLPSQILLNNLLYDSSQLAIPTDRVDEEQLRAPAHWNIEFIRRFMVTFGPISSLFDFVTFGLMIGVLHAGSIEFRTGWFIESLATQTLIIFAIRTHRVPFWRSRPGPVLTAAAAITVATGVALTVSPLSARLGFTPLPWQFFLALAVLTIAYLTLVEAAKRIFYTEPISPTPQPRRTRGAEHRVHRRAARFNHPGPAEAGRGPRQ